MAAIAVLNLAAALLFNCRNSASFADCFCFAAISRFDFPKVMAVIRLDPSIRECRHVEPQGAGKLAMAAV